MAKKPWDQRAGEMVGKNIVPASKSTTIWPINFAAELVPAEAKIAANFGKGVWSGLTGGKAGEPAIPVAPVSTPAATQDTAVTPGLGPRAPVAPPVAVDPSVSGAGFTVNPLGTSPVRQGQAADQTPVAPVAASPLTENDFADPSDDGLAGGAANAGIAPANAGGVRTNRVQGSSMAMTSPAALHLAEVMAMGRADAQRSQRGGQRYDINGIEAQKLRAKWADAARQAFLGAMSPEQKKRFEAEEAANAMQKSSLYRQTPEAMEADAGRKRDVEVAKEAGAAAREKNSLVYEGMKQEAALKREELALRQKGDSASLEQADRLAARQEDLRKTLSTDERKDKLADREEARRARMLDSIGRRIDKLSENAGDAKVDKRIAELQSEYDKLAGVGGEPEQQNAQSRDMQAIQWAQANPNDPRSKAILERNGIAPVKRTI